MKIFKIKLLVLAFSTIILLDSCSVTKRRYNKGFHIDWFQGNKDKEATTHSTSKKEVILLSSEKATDTKSEAKIDETASLAVNIPSKKLVSPSSNTSTYSPERRIVEEKNNRPPKQQKKITENVKSIAKKLKKSESNNEQQSSRGIGVFLLVLGILILLFVSWLLGGLLAVLGIILMSRNPKPTYIPPAAREESKKEPVYVDVVYLKNGSIIRGMIMEQIPNESLKIKTADGSIFVYKIEEVEKITKEPK